jgi:hypothetical protein
MKTADITKFLDSLAHKRFNEETLTNELSKFFDCKIEFFEATFESPDHCYCFNVNKDELFLYVEISYLMQKNVSFISGSTIYITEVSYDFSR